MRTSVGYLIILLGLFRIEIAYSQSDSTLLDFDAFMEMVQKNHPLSKQANLMIDLGEANLRKAKGNFDPVLKSVYDQKQFDGKDYYQLNTNQISIPTPLGLEIKAGYDKNTGLFVNPENQLPNNGLAYAGIAVPIGTGLLFDERRQEIRQAEVYERATNLERTLLLNQLIFDASKAYWNWYTAWNTYRIYDESVRLADFRFQSIRSSYLQGDLPAIDTLEAYILVQNREISRNDALIKMQKAKLEASNFLWSNELQPLALTESSRPIQHEELRLSQPLEEALLESVISNLDVAHPKMQLIYNKLENLNFERRMKAEKVKPKLNFNYNFLNQPVNGNPLENISTNDFKWGFEFSMPLLLRKGRGDLQITKIKMDQTNLDRQQEGLMISNKIKANQVEIENLYEQIALYRNAVENYEFMLKGEKRKFEEGESSLFIVNSRENSLITAEIKLIELLSKYQTAHAGLILAMGGTENLL